MNMRSNLSDNLLRSGCSGMFKVCNQAAAVAKKVPSKQFSDFFIVI